MYLIALFFIFLYQILLISTSADDIPLRRFSIYILFVLIQIKFVRFALYVFVQSIK